MKILVVCLGNICRSPMAEGILQRLADERGLEVDVDSAGTSHWHVGEPPDGRAISECAANGLDITSQRARQIAKQDLQDFDLILTMDKSNYANVMRLVHDDGLAGKIFAITDFLDDPEVDHIPDPYFDGGFSRVYTLLERVCGAVLDNLPAASKPGAR